MSCDFEKYPFPLPTCPSEQGVIWTQVCLWEVFVFVLYMLIALMTSKQGVRSPAVGKYFSSFWILYNWLFMLRTCIVTFRKQVKQARVKSLLFSPLNPLIFKHMFYGKHKTMLNIRPLPVPTKWEHVPRLGCDRLQIKSTTQNDIK